MGGQIKWQRVGPKKVNFYFDLIDLFKSFGNTLRFRCIVVDSNEVDFPLFHNDDRELGFYKFYYQLLHHWILDFNEYHIFCDTKTNRRLDRLKTLKNCLSSSNLSSKIISIQPIPSKESALIQFRDFLLGAVGSAFNKSIEKGKPREAILNHLKDRLGWEEIVSTSKDFEKFNIFKIDLKGGW